MSVNKLYDLARMTTLTTGTGTLSLGSAVTGFLTFAAAGAQNGDVVYYAITDGANSETGIGTYNSSAQTLTRTVLTSTNGNTPISLSGTAQVAMSVVSQTINDILAAIPVAPKLLNTVTGSSVSSLADTTSLASGAYTSYTMRLSGLLVATNNTSLVLEVYANGAWQTTAYDTVLYADTAGTAASLQSTANTSAIYISYASAVGNTYPLSSRLELWNVATTNFMLTGESIYVGAAAVHNTLSGRWNGAYPVTGVRVRAASGNISGTMKIYGNP